MVRHHCHNNVNHRQTWSASTYYFAKRDSDETICEKLMRLNILPNQFYAALAIFSAPKRGGAEPPPPNFRLGGAAAPLLCRLWRR